mgnify:CR=1 FL=1
MAIFLRKKRPYVLTGWFWYVGMLVPVIGIVQIGEQGHADRYTYLPHIGLFLLIVWASSRPCNDLASSAGISLACASDDHRSFKLSRGCPDLVLEE